MSYYDSTSVYSKQKFYNVYVTHMNSDTTISFPAFLTNYQDTFTNSYQSLENLGGVSPTKIHENTSRQITVSIQIPSHSLSKARSNFYKLKTLGIFMYPKRTPITTSAVARKYQLYTINNNSTMNLIKIKFANLIGSGIKGEGPGLVGFINEIQISPIIEHGFFEARGAIYPKSYDLNLVLEVVHITPENLQTPNQASSGTGGTTTPQPPPPPPSTATPPPSNQNPQSGTQPPAATPPPSTPQATPPPPPPSPNNTDENPYT